MLHEITHNLGAVQDVAAHSSFRLFGRAGGGHCTDGPDVMCPNPSSATEPCYDCGKDDYFDVDPPWGGNLAAHWNVAHSVFMCDYSLPSPAGCAPSPLFAATRDNRLWARDPVLSDVSWQEIGHANDVVAMAATGGKLFAADRYNRLWARDPVLSNINWQHIGHANDVVAMAATGSKLFAADRHNQLWARDLVLSNVNWQHIGHANDVVAMAAIEGKLFAADRYNRLWARDPVLSNINWQHIGHANDVVAMAAAPLDDKIRMLDDLPPGPPEWPDPRPCSTKHHNPPEVCGPE